MNRFHAFLIHLGISLLIFAVLAYLVLYTWYPDFFFSSDGGWQGMRIIVFVDLVLGPTLTLVVFNRTKPPGELRRDLSIIGTVQALCLAAGTYVVYMERPLALVYSDGLFYSMTADDYTNAGVPIPDFDGIPGPYPKRIMVKLPQDYAAQSQVRGEALRKRIPLRAMAEWYSPLDLQFVATRGEPLSEADLERREETTGDVSAWLADHGGSIGDYSFFRFGARYGNLILGLSRRDGSITGLMDTDIGQASANLDGTSDS